jgi:uncharacterized membrane protein
MKPTLKIALILAFFMLMPLASAQSIKDFNIEIQISGQKTLVNYSIETDMPQIQLILPEDAKIIEISANYTQENNEILADIQGNKLALSYETEEFIEASKYFTADFQIPETENLAIRLILPEQATIEKAYPSPELTSDGRHIILDWKSQNTNDFPVFVVYNEKTSNLALILAIIAIILIAIPLIIILAKKRKPKIKAKVKKPKEAKEIHLLESENAVIKALKEGIVWQKQIQLKTGFSKAKLSRTIRNLEARKLVKRIPLGNTNKIKLLK